MTRIQDSSEIQEASRLIADLLKPAAPRTMEERPAPEMTARREPAPATDPLADLLKFADELGKEVPAAATASSPRPVAPEAVQPPERGEPAVAAAPEAAEKKPEKKFRGDKLEDTLDEMCRRGGFTGAVVADNTGLPLAVHNSPVGADAIAAFTTVLGGALEKAGTLLGQHGAETISMDISYADKVVLRLFTIEGKPYFIMILCPRNSDERGEIELSIKRIVAILTQG